MYNIYIYIVRSDERIYNDTIQSIINPQVFFRERPRYFFPPRGPVITNPVQGYTRVSGHFDVLEKCAWIIYNVRLYTVFTEGSSHLRTNKRLATVAFSPKKDSRES